VRRHYSTTVSTTVIFPNRKIFIAIIASDTQANPKTLIPEAVIYIIVW
jgi:hypothetical protein